MRRLLWLSFALGKLMPGLSADDSQCASIHEIFVEIPDIGTKMEKNWMSR
jgi:hypothetical protein